jgi:predicted small lipoprotein YifL
MKMKRIIALLLSFVIIFSLVGCSNNENLENPEQDVNAVVEDVSDNETDVDDSTATDNSEESTTEIDKTNDSENKDDKNSSSDEETAKLSDNPSDWTKEQVVEEYKKAAKASHSSTKTKHEVIIKKISVNNGQFEGFFDFIMSIMSKFLENNTDDKDGITGGYSNLTADDVKSAKAYKVGDKIAIELVMKDQVSGMKEPANSGSVGHAITTVGDISDVVKQFKDLGLPLELNENETKIYHGTPSRSIRRHSFCI